MGRRGRKPGTGKNLLSWLSIIMIAGIGLLLGIILAGYIIAPIADGGSSGGSNQGSGGGDLDSVYKIIVKAEAALESLLLSFQPQSVSLEVGIARFYVDSPIIEVVFAVVALLIGISLAMGIYRRVR